MHTMTIDDLLTEIEKEKLITGLTDKNNIRWTFINKSNQIMDDVNMKDAFMFESCLFRKGHKYDSRSWMIANRIVKKIKEKRDDIGELCGCYYRMSFYDPNFDKNNYCRFEESEGDITAIYYLEDGDGDTFLFDGQNQIIETISPKEGRIVIFDNTPYAHQLPYESLRRCVLTFNFMRKVG